MTDREKGEAKVRSGIADLCELLAVRLDDGRFKSAAAMLRGNKSGRRKIDDAPMIRYAQGLLASGLAKSPHRACEQAAILYCRSHEVASTRDRLRKKLSDASS